MPPPPPSLHTLTPDLAYHILSHLSPSDLSLAASVSRSWRRLALDDHLWRRFIRAPPGLAHRHYLRDAAWRSARAHHTQSTRLSAPPAAVQLLPDDRVLAATLASPADARARTRLDGRGLATLQPARLARHDPCCVRARFCDKARVAYVAYGYRHGVVALYAVSLHADAAEPPDAQRLLLARTRGAEHVTCVDVLLHSGSATVVAGTAAGSLAVCGSGSAHAGDGRPRDMVRVPVSQFGVCSVAGVGDAGAAVVGTAGGEVVTVDVSRGTRVRYYVGPCSCGVTAVEVACGRVVVAGFAHRVPGNGHRSAAVAWDRGTGARLAAFGRGEGVRSSAAFPAQAVGMIRGDGAGGKRVGVLVGGRVRTYEVGDWRCEVEAGLGEGRAVDMDGGRLAVGCVEDGEGVVHTLDFGRAREWRPEEVECFRPCGREWGVQAHSV